MGIKRLKVGLLLRISNLNIEAVPSGTKYFWSVTELANVSGESSVITPTTNFSQTLSTTSVSGSVFIDYVVTSGIKLDHWCREELYEKYVIDLIKTESVNTALERSITHMMTWADNNNAQWNHYFLYVSLSRAMYDIKDGKISPWLVLNCKSGKDMLQKLNDEQLVSIGSVIDLPFWMNKFKRSAEDVELVRQVVKESKI